MWSDLEAQFDEATGGFEDDSLVDVTLYKKKDKNG